MADNKKESVWNRKCNTGEKKDGVLFGSVCVVIIVCLQAFCALLVHWLSPKIPSLITADGMLSYIISGISASATIVLAGVAYSQTERANSMADKLAEQANRTAEQANELARKSEETAKKSNELALESNQVAQQSNEIAEKSCMMASQANELTKQANELTKQANDLSKQVTDLEEKRYKIEVEPYFLVTDWAISQCIINDKRNTITYQVGSNSSDDIVVFILELTNTTQHFEIVQYSSAKTLMSSEAEEADIKWNLFSVAGRNSLSIGIPAGESKKMCFSASKEFFSKLRGHCIDMEFILINRFGNRFNEKVKLWITLFNWDTGDCMIHPQDYKIQGYSKNHKVFPE